MASQASWSMVRLDSKQPPAAVGAGVSLHSASVHISSFPEAVTNPHPWSQDQEQLEGEGDVRESLNQGYLSPMKLVQLTEEPDLARVSYLELSSINTSESSVGNFGSHLPNLTQLRFTDSTIPCVRDLGTNLGSLKVLWMSCCKMKDLDGLPALQNLQEFYLPFNEVQDISVITMLSSLDVLDLESNNLSEEDQLGYLALCPSLVSVTLEGNPLSTLLAEAHGGEAGYRAAVCEVVPTLQVLDDMPLRPVPEDQEVGVAKEEDMSARSSLFSFNETGMEKDWQILQQSIKQGLQLEQDVVSPVTRPKTAPAHRPPSISPAPSPSLAVEDESSELTHGLSQVICGNPVRALRARKHHGLTSQSATSTCATPPPYPSPLSDDESFLTQLQDMSLEPISEDVVVTRAISEENLLEDTGQQPAHLSRLPTPPNRLPTPPKRLPTPPKAAPPSVTDPSYVRSKSVADFRHRRYRKLSADNPRSLTKPPHRTRHTSTDTPNSRQEASTGTTRTLHNSTETPQASTGAGNTAQ